MPGPNERIIFGSYNSRDRNKVVAIAEDLQSLGIKLWLDTELTPGTICGRALEDMIDRAKAAVIFVGGERGKWQELEIFMLLQNQVAGKLSVLIPVLLGGAGENAGGFLSNIEHFDMRTGGRTPLHQLADALRATPDENVGSLRGKAESTPARALLEWIVQEATDPGEVLKYAERCIRAWQWPEALYTCKRLQNLALDRLDGRLFAKSCEKAGEIHFVSGEQDLAERQWKISRAVFMRYGSREVASHEARVQEIRSRVSSGSTQPASLQL